VYSASNPNGGTTILTDGATVLTEPLSIPRRAVPRSGTRIAGLAVSDAAESLSQAQVLERLGLSGDEFAERIFARSGVERRHLSLSEDFLARTLQGRTEQIERELLSHSIEAVERLRIDPRRIGTVISASLYSLGCPTIAHRLVEHFEMDPTTDKYHITGVGCASGVPLMRLAAQAMHEHPEKHALVVAADSMSGTLMSATEDDPKAKTVGSAIFGDGCAAALLSNDPRAEGPLILASQVHQIADTLGAVRLNVQGESAYLHLARELPDLAGAGLPAIVAGFLRRNQLEHADIDHWVVHPGGRRIVENVQSALELSAEDVATSWDALADHGNIGTPSILYVLRDTIERYKPEPGERGLLVTIGPGVTVGLMLVGW
jgi:alkylresorcinol/alkylpyrone synthase